VNFELTPAQLAWQAEVREFLDEHMSDDLRAEVQSYGRNGTGPLAEKFYHAVAGKGWTALTWPKEYGGLGGSATHQLIMSREFDYAGAPRILYMWTGIAAIIMRYGTQANRDAWLPRIKDGSVTMALGYSEPEAGTDLASLRTTAVLDGDEWVINGEKIWNSEAHFSTHEWLAVRTDQHAPKHRGISLVIVPTDAAGVEIFPIAVWSQRTNRTVFTNVRVPIQNLIGEPNLGWTYLGGALDFERATIGGYVGSLQRLLDGLVAYARNTVVDGTRLADVPHIRSALAELAIDIELAGLMGLEVAAAIDSGGNFTIPATAQKVFTTELRARVADTGTRLLGMTGQLSMHDDGAPLKGFLEWSYRWAPVQRFGGGTNEVMRDIIAQRGLGLPRLSRGALK
jgi:3-oxocholest-4-en-26-oyl-CoA dehydrogenase alpha subunit